MTQEEIIRIALEAGIIHAQDTDGQWDGITDQQLLCYPYTNPRSQEWAEKRIVEILEPFASIVAALVAAHGREKQAEQEPVGIVHDAYDTQGIEWKGKDPLPTGTPLYTAPVSIAKQSETDSSSSSMRTTVRTKDLTDDEIMKINVDTAGIVPICDRQFHFARAVIAADREKNRA